MSAPLEGTTLRDCILLINGGVPDKERFRQIARALLSRIGKQYQIGNFVINVIEDELAVGWRFITDSEIDAACIVGGMMNDNEKRQLRKTLDEIDAMGSWRLRTVGIEYSSGNPDIDKIERLLRDARWMLRDLLDEVEDRRPTPPAPPKKWWQFWRHT